MKWYHEWQEGARDKFFSGHYPGHERVPNFIVRALYGVGYFLGDFVPLILNFIDGIYTAIKRLLAFIVGLLIEASTVIVLIGTIAFSVVHSIELLRRAGATGGLEYVGVLMFEVVFISSTAMMTGMFMSGKKLRKNPGFWFCVSGFTVGTLFVLWSNISAMAPSWEGKIIGIMTPVLLIIAEGLLAYRNMDVVNKKKNGGLETSKQETPENRSGELDNFKLEKVGNLEGAKLETPENPSGGLEKSELETLETSSGKLEKFKLESLEEPEKSPAEKGDIKLENKPEKTEETPAVNLENQLENAVKIKLQKTTENAIAAGVSKLEETVNYPAVSNVIELETSNEKLENRLEENTVGGLENSNEKLENNLEENAVGELEKLEGELEKKRSGELEASEKKLEEKLELETSKKGNPPTSNKLELENELEETKTSKPKKPPVKKVKVRKTRKSSAKVKEKDPLAIARKIMQEEGEPPGRGRLMKEAGCKEWPARKAIDELIIEVAMEKAQEILEEGKLPSVEELQKLVDCKKDLARIALKRLEKQLEVTA